MKTKDLKYYLSCFKKLHRDRKNGGAPHKPILLISVIQAFQQNLIQTAEIYITPELVGLFKSNWSKFVQTNHQCLFTLPFYHMQSEPFWQLVPNKGCELWVKSKSSMRSLSNLTTAIRHALIDPELAAMLKNKEDAQVLLLFILETYFPGMKQNLNHENNSYLNEIRNEIFEESQEKYQKRLLMIKEQLDNDEFQEEVFVRSSIFKNEVPKIYNYTCCISGFRVDSLLNISMVDACHIIPFSESYNDTITNGITLCPNLHRAFDRGLLSISDDYTVIIKKDFSENEISNYNLRQFNRRKILLPDNEKYFPSLQSLKYHRERHSF